MVPGELTCRTLAERPQLDAQSQEIGTAVWPEYNRHGDVLSHYWGRLPAEFAAFQFALVDEDTDVAAAFGWTIPCVWDGTPEGLPAGLDGAIEDAFAARERGQAPTALCALAAEIRPELQGAGLSRRVLEEMRALGLRHGLGDVIAPVRPSWKARYPLAPIERYARWQRADGRPFDPWIRVHARMGAAILRPEPRSVRITASVAEWERWIGLPLPESGEYVFPDGLATLSVDREAYVARYWEPNVWMHHRSG